MSQHKRLTPPNRAPFEKNFSTALFLGKKLWTSPQELLSSVSDDEKGDLDSHGYGGPAQSS